MPHSVVNIPEGAISGKKQWENLNYNTSSKWPKHRS
jgi:hypothetical protein